MRTHDVPGFILRTEAVKKYGRSKASFIRDFDKAFERGDTAFLENFRLYLNDGTMIEGPDASKEKMLSLQSKQPWVYIKESFLEGRYWDSDQSNSSLKPKKERPTKKEGSPVSKLTDATDTVQLEHENAVLKTKLAAQEQTIDSLKHSNDFLQDELKNRRGELREMTNLVDSMRLGLEAGKKPSESSVEKRTASTPSDTDASATDEGIIDVETEKASKADIENHSAATNSEPSGWEKHTPTFHRAYKRMFSRS